MSGPAQTLHLRVITPSKVVIDDYAVSVTAPSADGEVTVLPRHSNLFALLKEGVITIRRDKTREEEHLAISSGFLQTDGQILSILVSRAYGQHEIDEKQTQAALERAKKLLESAKDEHELHAATMLLRRSVVDLKLLKKRRKQPSSAV